MNPYFFNMLLKKTRMLEKYRIWQKPVIDKKKGKMRFDQKKWQYGFPGSIYFGVRIKFKDANTPGVAEKIL